MRKKLSIESLLHYIADSETFLQSEDRLSQLISGKPSSDPLLDDELSEDKLDWLVAAGNPNSHQKKKSE